MQSCTVMARNLLGKVLTRCQNREEGGGGVKHRRAFAASPGGAGSASVRVMAGSLAGACSSCVTERPRPLWCSGPLAAHIWKNSCSAGQAAVALVSTQQTEGWQQQGCSPYPLCSR